MSGEAEPYGDPRRLPQKTKYRVKSKAFPGPNKGPHQSSTSLLPESAWHMTKTLSRFLLRTPQVLYAISHFSRTWPESRVRDEINANFWSDIRSTYGFRLWGMWASSAKKHQKVIHSIDQSGRASHELSFLKGHSDLNVKVKRLNLRRLFSPTYTKSQQVRLCQA